MGEPVPSAVWIFPDAERRRSAVAGRLECTSALRPSAQQGVVLQCCLHYCLRGVVTAAGATTVHHSSSSAGVLEPAGRLSTRAFHGGRSGGGAAGGVSAPTPHIPPFSNLWTHIHTNCLYWRCWRFLTLGIFNNKDLKINQLNLTYI